MYDNETVAPMREELTRAGVIELTTSQEVDEHLQDQYKQVVFVNSVCGCAAASVRPAFISSLDHAIKPERCLSVFAGVDHEATTKAREYFVGYPPSSPALAFFRDGVMVYFIERNQLEGAPKEAIAQFITSVYDKYFDKDIKDAAAINDPFAIDEMTPIDLKTQLDAGSITLLDCREASERDIAIIKNSEPITQEKANLILHDWDKKKSIVFLLSQREHQCAGSSFFQTARL